MPRSATQLDAGKRGLNMNFDHEELTLMMLYNTGTRLGLVHELRLIDRKSTRLNSSHDRQYRMPSSA